MNQDWTYRKLGEACVLTMGQSPSSESYNKEGKGLPFFQGCSDFGKLNPTVKTFCNAPAKIAEIGDVLMSVRAPIGTLNIANVKCCIGRGLASFRALPNIDNMYLYYFLKHSNNCLQKQGTGSTFKAIGKESLYNFPIPVPPLAAQSRIVSELDLLQSIIDKQQAQLKELDTLAQAVFYDMFGDPVENEKRWKVKTWNDIFETKTGKLNANAMVDGGKYPFFTCSKESFFINEYAFDCEALLLAGNNASAKYDVKYYKGKFNAYQRTYVLTLKEGCYPFFKISLEQKLSLLQKQSIGGLTKYLTLGILEPIKFILPPLSLQQSFAAKIESIEKQKAAISQSIAETQKLFDYTMDKYFGE